MLCMEHAQQPDEENDGRKVEIRRDTNYWMTRNSIATDLGPFNSTLKFLAPLACKIEQSDAASDAWKKDAIRGGP